MKILFLDDNPSRHRAMRKNSIGTSVDYVFTADEALQNLNKKTYDLIMLDHDLSEDEKPNMIVADGYYVASYMAKKMKQHRETPVIIHSLNPTGASRMHDVLENAGYMFVHQIPFAWDKIMVRNDGEVVFRK
jgi:CheY-like chemotaxis protein